MGSGAGRRQHCPVRRRATRAAAQLHPRPRDLGHRIRLVAARHTVLVNGRGWSTNRRHRPHRRRRDRACSPGLDDQRRGRQHRGHPLQRRRQHACRCLSGDAGSVVHRPVGRQGEVRRVAAGPHRLRVWPERSAVADRHRVAGAAAAASTSASSAIATSASASASASSTTAASASSSSSSATAATSATSATSVASTSTSTSTCTCACACSGTCTRTRTCAGACAQLAAVGVPLGAAHLVALGENPLKRWRRQGCLAPGQQPAQPLTAA